MKLNIREKRAKKKVKNPELKKGLLDGQDDSSEDDAVYTDGKGQAIEMTSADSPPAARKTTPQKQSAAVSASSASRQSSAANGMEEVAIEIEQFPIPKSVRAKMGQHAPRYVCMGDGDAGVAVQFVQFLYDDFQKAAQACQYLKDQYNIQRQDGHPNRVTDCNKVIDHSTEKPIYPTFAKLGLYMVRIIVADYDREFGSAYRPQIKRTAFEAELNKAFPADSGQSASAQSSAGAQGFFSQGSHSGISGSSSHASRGPVKKVTADDSDHDEEEALATTVLSDDGHAKDQEYPVDKDECRLM